VFIVAFAIWCLPESNGSAEAFDVFDRRSAVLEIASLIGKVVRSVGS